MTDKPLLDKNGAPFNFGMVRSGEIAFSLWQESMRAFHMNNASTQWKENMDYAKSKAIENR